MSDEEAAKKAIQELDGASVDGRTINVSVAKPREERTGGVVETEAVAVVISRKEITSATADINRF